MTRLAPERTVATHRGLLQLALAALLYAAGLNSGAGWVVVLAAVLTGAVLAGWALVWSAARRVDVRREIDALGVAGVPMHAAVEVQVAGVGHVAVADAFTGMIGAGPAGSRFTARVVAPRGGRDEAPLRVSLIDHLGLVRGGACGPVRSPVLVVPAGSGAESREQAARGATDAGFARAPSGAEFAGVRTYAPGDPPRTVRWRASARHGRLLVGEPAQPSGPALRIAIDGGTWTREDLDGVVERACALADAASAAGRPVEIAADGRVRPWSPATRRDLALLPPHWGAPARPLAPPPRTAVETVELTADG